MIKKTIQKTEDYFVQFTDEELSELNIKPGDKFSCEIEENSIVLKKFATLELDMSEWSRDILEMLISISIEQDISVNDVICDIIDKHIKNFDV